MSDEVSADWHELANRVRNDLAAAGLTVTGDLEIDYRVGAHVMVDSEKDSAGGVWVAWKPHPHLAGAAATCLEDGRLDDPMVAQFGKVLEAMQVAMMTILQSAGYSVEDADEEYRPYELRITTASDGVAH